MGDGDPRRPAPARLSLRAAARGGPATARRSGPRSTSARRAAPLLHERQPPATPKGVLYSHRSVSLHSTDDLHRRQRSACARPTGCWPSWPMFHVKRVGPALRRRAHRRRACCCRARFLQGEALAQLSSRGERARRLAGRRTDGGSPPCSTTSTPTAATSARCAAGICGGSGGCRAPLMEGFERHGVSLPAGVGHDRDEPDPHRRSPACGGSTRARSTGPIARPRAASCHGRRSALSDGAGEIEARGPVGWRPRLLRGTRRATTKFHRRRLAGRNGRHRRARRAGLRGASPIVPRT